MVIVRQVALVLTVTVTAAVVLLGAPALAMAVCGDSVVDVGETCDDGNITAGDCCSATCQIEVAGTVCRASTGECDLAESCDGLADSCPGDGFVAASTVCTDEGVGCTSDLCDGVGVCVHTEVDAACDDTLFCTGVESCNAALDCQAGTPPDCSDGEACSVDSCNEQADVCIHMPAHHLCGDGVYCNGDEICNVATGCSAGAAVDCSGLSSSCSLGSCDELTEACVSSAVNETSVCDDLDFCSTDDQCTAGACTGTSDPQFSSKLKMKRRTGAANDSFILKSTLQMGYLLWVDCQKSMDIVLTGGDGTALFAAQVPAATFPSLLVGNSSGRKKCLLRDKTGTVAGGMRKVKLITVPSKAIARLKVSMKGVELDGALGQVSVLASMMLDSAGSFLGSCVTAKPMTCSSRGSKLICEK
jgi:cysteine-rich repeat protein